MFLLAALACLNKDTVGADTALTAEQTDAGSPGDGGPGGGGPGGGPGGGTDDTGTTGGTGGGPGGGTDDTGTTGGDGGGPGGGGTEVSGDLAGRTYAVDIAATTFVEPSGLGSLLSLAGPTVLLFHIASEGADSFKMVVTVADGDGQQNPCERVIDLPTAEFDNPEFTIRDSDLELVVNDEPLTVANTLISGVFGDEGTRWDDGVIRGTMDTRELAPILSDDVSQDLCELLEFLGSSCGPCDDGSDTCFTLDLADVSGEPHAGTFEPDPECD